MKTILAALRDVRVWTGLLLLVLGVLLLLFGGRFGLSMIVRIVVVAVLVLIEVAVVVLVGRAKARAADDIESSILLEADSLVMTSTGAHRAASEQAREELLAAINELKKSKIAGGRSGRAALSVLPWYLVLGRPGSGKSTMIRNCGLPFPGSKPGETDRFRGVGAGSSVQWWFTSHAVILEASGRLAGKEDDVEPRGDWAGALDVLRKSRPGTPVNGLVITVSMEDLIRHDSARLDEQARVLRQRLDASVEHLEAHCPVYLVITKSDLIHGFEEFFRDLEGSARDQVFGVTFSLEQLAADDPLPVFAREFRTLYRSLCKRRIPRMMSENRAGGRGNVYLFPLEFQTLQAKLQRFVKTLVSPNPYGDSPLFRGFYFASGRTEGSPVEMVLNEVSRVIGLPPDLDGSDVTQFISQIPGTTAHPEDSGTTSTMPRADGEPRFLRELFTRILLRDANLARPTKGARRTRRLQRLGLRIGGLSLAALLAILMLVSFVRNRSLVTHAVDLAWAATDMAPGASSAAEIEKALRDLDPFREHLQRLDAMDRMHSRTLSFGLYRGETVNKTARLVYLKALVNVLLGPSRAKLQNDLRRGVVDVNAASGEFTGWYEDYRAYRMLFETEQADPAFLAARLVHLWTKAPAQEDVADRIRETIPLHIAFAWNTPRSVSVASQRLPVRDERLVADASFLIRQNWQPARFYDTMIEQANERMTPVSLDAIALAGKVLRIDPDSLAVDATVAAVPGAYTMVGWEEQIADRISNCDRELKNDWILMEAFSDAPDDMRPWLEKQYLDDYISHWIRFLSAVDLQPQPGVQAAVDQFRTLSSGSTSPLALLIERAADNLRVRDARKSPALAPLAERFRALHSLLENRNVGDEKFRPVDKVLEHSVGLYEALRRLKENPARGKAATEFAKAHLAVGGEPDAIAIAVQFANRHGESTPDVEFTGDPECTEAIRTLLRRPAEGAWGSVLAECQTYLDQLWESEVYQPFQIQRSKFPFNSRGPDIPLVEFEQYFSPTGIISTFLDGELAPFLDRGVPVVRNRHGLHLGPETARAIAKAQAIRSALFDGAGSLGFTFHATPSLPKREPISGAEPPFAQRTTLQIGSQRDVYNMGPRVEKTFKWPAGESAFNNASIRAGMAEGEPIPEEIVVPGDWAFFKLLYRADTIVQNSATETEVRWRLVYDDGGGRSFAIHVPWTFRAESSINPFVRDFFEFDCPRQLGSS